MSLMMPSTNIDTVPRHEVIDERFRSIVLGNAALERLATGLRWAEGPVWIADQAVLLVSDIPNDRILRITESGEVSTFRSPAGFPNGQTRDRQGRLLTCSHLHRCIFRTSLNGDVKTLVDTFSDDGVLKRLNSPNDIVVMSDDSIWFTDPTYGIESDYEGMKQTSELPAAVFVFTPGSAGEGQLRPVAKDFQGPNGLCFSPDESTLYISESGDQFAAEPLRHIRSFKVNRSSHTLSGGEIFYKVSPGYADGMKCDSEGNLWTGGEDGVNCIDPAGKLLGKIYTPAPVSNLCFGGRLNSRLFLCCGDSVFAITVNRRGAAML